MLIKNKLFPMSQGKWENWNSVSPHNCWLSYHANEDEFGRVWRTEESHRHISVHLSRDGDTRGKCTDLLSEFSIQGIANK